MHVFSFSLEDECADGFYFYLFFCYKEGVLKVISYDHFSSTDFNLCSFLDFCNSEKL